MLEEVQTATTSQQRLQPASGVSFVLSKWTADRRRQYSPRLARLFWHFSRSCCSLHHSGCVVEQRSRQKTCASARQADGTLQRAMESSFCCWMVSSQNSSGEAAVLLERKTDLLYNAAEQIKSGALQQPCVVMRL